MSERVTEVLIGCIVAAIILWTPLILSWLMKRYARADYPITMSADEIERGRYGAWEETTNENVE